MSLLLDALKKAAEEKLANKDQDDGSTRVDSTEAVDIAESTVAGQQLQDETSVAYDATMVDHTGMPPESSVANNTHEDLTSFDFEPVNNENDEGVDFSDTEVGLTKSDKEPTELEAITDIPFQKASVYTDIGSEETVIGAQDDHAIDLDETGIDVTEVQVQHDYETVRPNYPESTIQKTSLTDNFVKQNYEATPEAAGSLLGVSSSSHQPKFRLFMLLGLVLLLALGVLSLFAYQYHIDSSEVDYKLTYQQYKTKRKIDPITAVNKKNEKAGATIKDEIVVEQEDYVSLLDTEFNAIEQQSRPASVKQKTKKVSASIGRQTQTKPVATRAIKIKRVKQESSSASVIEAYEAFNDGDIAAAKTLYEKALNSRDNKRDAKLGLAAIAITEGNTANARLIYADLLEENPSDSVAIAGLAALGPTAVNANKQNTLSSIKLMIEQQPEAADLHFTLGNLYADESRWPEAQKAFFNAYSLDSGNPDYLYNLAVSLDYMGKQAAALPFYQQALVQSGLRQNNIPVAAAEQRVNTIQKK